MSVPTVIHERHVSWYRDDLGNFGFSARAAYALGYDKPHYPVPAPAYFYRGQGNDWHIERVMLWCTEVIDAHVNYWSSALDETDY